ncbi:uncharacterized protein LOC111276228 [Durio zibethinus]|uniref:RING-type E3 ubiquitin transferase n=1 Tax=Durio zibethinus TaxID=66656 RepID=A0A6P5WP03_DURZI|nr:uncharacterized protein LOC111276228 [Durio zibethinus]
MAEPITKVPVEMPYLVASTTNTLTDITTLITGTLESLSSSDEVNYFEPVSIIMFPRLNYECTFDSRDCNTRVTAAQERRIAFLLHVGNYLPFNPNTTWIGEGKWDDKKNRLFVSVCQILDIRESWSDARVGDCTTRLSFTFPAILSIRETSRAMGKIWTTKAANDSGYFDRILFRSTENHLKGVPGKKYPSGHSTDMKFGVLLKNSERKYGWCMAVPLAIGDQLYKQYLYPNAPPSFMFERAVPASWIESRPINVSYVASITLQTPTNAIDGVYFSYLNEEKVEITAEGVYDSETGKLCMVGCRKLGSNNQVFENASVDCEILLNFQLAPLEPNKNGGDITGSIESTRKESDPLYFDRLDVFSAAYKTDQGRRSVPTMDLETKMVLISNLLVCFFVGLQLYHVKKNPKVLSLISLVMLVILTLGYMIPLVLDFETLCSNKQDQDKVLSHGDGWFELNEVIVTVVMVVAFLLLLRLFQLTISARSHDSNQKCLWFAEEMTLVVIAYLCAAGAKITLLVASEKYRPEDTLLLSSSIEYQHRPICNDLKSFADLLLDSFLLPQILLNMSSNSKQNALSCSFYVGTTFVRLLPRAYDLYRGHSYVLYNILHFSVNHDEDFLSAAWDVIMLLELLLLAAIIYFQQKFGGHCILPSRLRELETYPEEVPFVSESSRPKKMSA